MHHHCLRQAQAVRHPFDERRGGRRLERHLHLGAVWEVAYGLAELRHAVHRLAVELGDGLKLPDRVGVTLAIWVHDTHAEGVVQVKADGPPLDEHHGAGSTDPTRRVRLRCHLQPGPWRRAEGRLLVAPAARD